MAEGKLTSGVESRLALGPDDKENGARQVFPADYQVGAELQEIKIGILKDHMAVILATAEMVV
jgi:hypothetical protein